MKNNRIYIFLSLLLIAGLVYRLIGIKEGLSFWNDEDHAALMSRFILIRGVPTTDFGYTGGLYQIALYYVTATSFIIFGVTEFAGRLPSVLIGTILIFLVYYYTMKVTNSQRVAIMAAFLTSFSQIQLAWSTQLRPYIWLELFTVITIYYAYQFLKHKSVLLNYNLAFGFFWSTLSVLFHGSGFIPVALVSSALILKIITLKKYKYFMLLLPIALASLILLFLAPHYTVPLLLKFDFRVWHYVAFFKEYIWLFVPAFFGAIHLWYKNRNLFVVLPVFIVIIFALAIFKLNTQYVRYSLPAMPLLYILFSIGFFALLDLLSFKQSRSTKTIVAIVLLLGFIGAPIIKGKIIVWPKYYYSINNDVRENPIVDYKLAFERIKKMIGDKKNVIVMDAWNDRVQYYLPKQKFIFMTRSLNKTTDPHFGIINSIYMFNDVKKRYSRGLVIVENWESMTPPELQDYIRKTLNHEFDVNNLPYNEDDKWSISIYSWGF